MSKFSTKLAVETVNGVEVRALLVPAPVVQLHDLGSLFNVPTNAVNVVMFDNTRSTVWVKVGQQFSSYTVPATIKTLEDAVQMQSKEEFFALKFFCFLKLQSIASLTQLIGWSELECQTILEAEIEEAPVQEETKEEPAVEKEPALVMKRQAIQAGTIQKLNLGEIFFRVSSSLIHQIELEHTEGRGFTGVYVSLKTGLTLSADEYINGKGLFGAETAVAIATFANKATRYQLPTGFVLPDMLLVAIPANGESPAAGTNKEESVNTMNKKSIHMDKTHEEAAREAVQAKFSTILQSDSAVGEKLRALRLRAADKSPQAISLQFEAAHLQAYYVKNHRELIKVNMLSIFNPEEYREAVADGTAGEGLDAGNYMDTVKITKRVLVDGEAKEIEESVTTYDKNIIFVATENNKIEKMKIKEKETAYILSNESAQTRVASRGLIMNVEVENTDGEIARLRVQDSTNLSVGNFNGNIPNIMLNHLFYQNGVYMRTRTAPEDLNELTSVNDLVQFTTAFDTPSQKRQAKVSFLMKHPKFTVYNFLKGTGNDILGYVKKSKEMDGYYIINVLKAASRLGLLGSASKELKGFKKLFGKFASKKVLDNGSVVITTTTGLKVLLCDDVTGEAHAQAKVFNANVTHVKPGLKDTLTTFFTSKNFKWNVNVTDGGIISDLGLFGPLLEGHKLVARKRNGRLRGYAHQFRINAQVKGLNVVAPGVKELTGYDMILFDGARKTDLVALLEEGKTLEYHVMLTASTFMKDSVSRISAQVMNNLNIPYELALEIAKENFKKAEDSINDVEKRMEGLRMMHNGKDLVTAESAFSKGFNANKFANVNPIVFNDVYAKLEIKAEVIEFMKTHKGGYLYTNAKNNYMFSDLYAVLKAVQDGTFKIDEKNVAAKAGEVILPMMDEEKKRFFYEGRIMSIRSPHVVNDETQFATAVNPLNSDNKELVKYWTLWLEAGVLDGITFFSAIDIMVPASSGADFDGDTSLIILSTRIMDAVKRTPQYLNFHVKPYKEGQSPFAYEIQNGILLGGYVDEKNNLLTEEQKAEREEKGLPIRLVQDSSVLGEGSAWPNPAPAPAFKLPKGYFQDDYTIYIPKDKIHTEEAYEAWVDAMHIAIRSSISASDIGQMSNITMAITNGKNYIEQLIAEAKAEGRDTDMLEAELHYYEQMLDVMTYVVWVSIDAAKHGGAYKEYLAQWIDWAIDAKARKAEMKATTFKSMRRIIGAVPDVVDSRTGETRKTKIAVIRPNVIVEQKYGFKSKKASKMETNIEKYANAVAAIYKEAEADRNNIKIQNNTLLETAYGILKGSDFPTALAKDVFAKFSEYYEKNNWEYKKQMDVMRAQTKEILSGGARNFDAMNSSKQTAEIKGFFHDYTEVRRKQKVLLAKTQQELRNRILQLNMDLVKFAAAAYVYAYEKALELEDKNNKRAKAPIYALWKLIPEELFEMLASLEGARVSKMRNGHQMLNLTKLYFHPTEAFKAKGADGIKAAIEAEGAEIALKASEFETGSMDVYLTANNRDAVEADLIGRVPAGAASKFVNRFSYRIHQSKVKIVVEKGITLDLGPVFMYGNQYEGLRTVSAKAFYDRKDMAKLVVPVALFQGATMQDLEQAEDKKFVSLVKNGTAFFGIKEESSIRPVASTTVATGMVEGIIYSVDVEFSEFEGTLKAYVYAAAKATK